MCRECDGGGITTQEWLDRLQARVDRVGWAVQHVLGSARSADVAYTLGLTAQGLPELVVTGLGPAPAAELLDSVADYLTSTSTVLPGETMEAGPYLLELLRVDRPEDHLLGAVDLYGDSVRAMQLAWADDRGRWPWDVGHRAPRGGQPLLGSREPSWCDLHRPPA